MLGGARSRRHAATSPRPNRRSTSLRSTRRSARIAAAVWPGSAQRQSHILGAAVRPRDRRRAGLSAAAPRGELRQGALEGVLLDAVARAADLPAARVRRAAMLAGALAPVARVALDRRRSRAVALSPAAVPAGAADARRLGGRRRRRARRRSARRRSSTSSMARASRCTRSATRCASTRETCATSPPRCRKSSTPSARCPRRELILDGEAIALRAGRHAASVSDHHAPLRPQARCRPPPRELPLSPFFFDALYLDGAPLIDEPLARRVALLDGSVSAANRVPRLVTREPGRGGRRSSQRALAAGHEGVMAKALDGAYAAGRRGSAWLKVKHAHTLDLVVLAAEWGSGRRRGTLSNLHLGAATIRERGGFVMLGKTFKGLTDEMLAWQTRELLALEIGRDGHTVFVRPELVVEIAFNDIQESPHYPGGARAALRAREALPDDKTAAEADTFKTVQRSTAARPTGFSNRPSAKSERTHVPPDERQPIRLRPIELTGR